MQEGAGTRSVILPVTIHLARTLDFGRAFSW
jgi:hypothetical protein